MSLIFYIVMSCVQATGVSPEQLLVTVLPGLPTASEFFLLPDKQLTEGKPDKTSTHLDQVLNSIHYSSFVSLLMYNRRKMKRLF